MDRHLHGCCSIVLAGRQKKPNVPVFFNTFSPSSSLPQTKLSTDPKYRLLSLLCGCSVVKSTHSLTRAHRETWNTGHGYHFAQANRRHYRPYQKEVQCLLRADKPKPKPKPPLSSKTLPEGPVGSISKRKRKGNSRLDITDVCYKFADPAREKRKDVDRDGKRKANLQFRKQTNTAQRETNSLKQLTHSNTMDNRSCKLHQSHTRARKGKTPLVVVCLYHIEPPFFFYKPVALTCLPPIPVFPPYPTLPSKVPNKQGTYLNHCYLLCIYHFHWVLRTSPSIPFPFVIFSPSTSFTPPPPYYSGPLSTRWRPPKHIFLSLPYYTPPFFFSTFILF